MSRTYHHGDRNRAKYYTSEYSGRSWLWREPKWWRKMTKHKKRRAQTRMAISRVMKGNEDTLFPLNTKPWIYYW